MNDSSLAAERRKSGPGRVPPELHEYLARGWLIFPCVPSEKRPLTARGLHDASSDLDQVREWLQRWPAANWAIRCGAPGPFVVDIDVKPGGTGYGAWNRLTREGLVGGWSRLVSTPSGGAHFYFDGDEQGNGSIPSVFLDARGVGGYVLAPPAAIGGKRYALLEERPGGGRVDWRAVRELLAPAPPVEPRPTAVSRRRDTGGRLSPIAAFNRDHEGRWAEFLTAAGYAPAGGGGRYWRRPGSTTGRGHDAALRIDNDGVERLYVHSYGDSLHAEQAAGGVGGYSPWDFYVAVKFGGDQRAAFRSLAGAVKV